jgi:RimJ/RimL family protein N-acetyltransferase
MKAGIFHFSSFSNPLIPKEYRMSDPNQNRIVFRMGKRIYLRPVLLNDVPYLTRWMNDQEVTHFLTAVYPITPEEEEKWIRGSEDRKSTDIVLAIVLADSDEIIGIQGLHRISFLDGEATMGYFIGRKDLWGQGYGTEAQMILLEYAFNTLNLHKVSAEVYDFNPRSEACLKKCGYDREGVKREHRYRNGRRVDSIILAVFKSNFLKLWEANKEKYINVKK